jgi:hypothetical protein
MTRHRAVRAYTAAQATAAQRIRTGDVLILWLYAGAVVAMLRSFHGGLW